MSDEQMNELERLSAEAKAQGLPLKAEAVVEAARPEDSVLHTEFEWNDSVAAEKFRVHQARTLIRAFIVYLPSLQRRVRAMISLPTDRHNAPGYRPVQDVLANPSWVSVLEEEVMSHLASLKQRYSHLSQFDLLWDKLNVTAAEYMVRVREQSQAG